MPPSSPALWNAPRKRKRARRCGVVNKRPQVATSKPKNAPPPFDLKPPPRLFRVVAVWFQVVFATFETSAPACAGLFVSGFLLKHWRPPLAVWLSLFRAVVYAGGCPVSNVVFLFRVAILYKTPARFQYKKTPFLCGVCFNKNKKPRFYAGFCVCFLYFFSFAGFYAGFCCRGCIRL